ncbi:MAG: hypothetical protein U0359_29250 [Byssovorax sp.]
MPPPQWSPPPSAPPQWAPPPSAPPPWAPPPEAPPPASDGITAKGLPLSQRGGVFLDGAGLSSPGVQVGTLDFLAKIPIRPHTFVDAILPLGFVNIIGAGFSGSLVGLGNPMMGVHHVLAPSDRTWLTLGGAFGFPLVTTYDGFSAARAVWDFQEFAVTTVPFALRAAFETHMSFIEMRAQLEPIFGISHRSGVDHLFGVQHAFEVQAGHQIGGGLRYQGMVFGTKAIGNDQYQGAFELFFRLYHDPLLLRLGLLLPVDKPLGQAFDNTWGFKVMTGWTLD